MPDLDINLNISVFADTCFQPHYKLRSCTVTADKPLFLIIVWGKESLSVRKHSQLMPGEQLHISFYRYLDFYFRRSHFKVLLTILLCITTL